MRLASIAGTAALLLALGGASSAQAQANVGLDVVVDTVDLVNPRLVNGVLTAPRGTITGTIGGLPFTTDIRRFVLDLTPAQQPGGDCPILNLELGPINLALLGLHVDTSRICLEITANGEEGILGDLLCGLAGLDLDDLLDQLLGGDLGAILEDVLGEVLGQARPGQGGGNNGNGNGNGNGGNGRVCRGQCEVLNLVLGPVNLSLLGLNVSLDNCRGGPVQICVSATAREGLLGQLLCGLAGGPGLLNLERVFELVELAQEYLVGGLSPLEQQGLARFLLQLVRTP